MWEALNRKCTGDSILNTFVAYIETSGGRVAYMPSLIKGDLKVLIFQPHFFRRFAERTGVQETGIDLIRRFFELNNGFYYTFVERPTAFRNVVSREVHGSSTEGVAMGSISRDGNTMFFRTFVSHDMLKGTQIDTFATTEKMRKEIHAEMIEEGMKYVRKSVNT